ncbi:MAG: capsule assembly Wzi family protein [Chitinophagaceae bacterium]|nr:capsule assembly Wzi family protein [Chitinophagaceae bacterium]
MKQIYLGLIVYIGFYTAFSQPLPMNNIFLEDRMRQKQIAGELQTDVSFLLKPLSLAYLQKDSSFDKSISLPKQLLHFWKNRIQLHLLPIQIITQYNSHLPYGWNDGSLIPAQGFQSSISTGFFGKIGFLTFQIKPEFVFATNGKFNTFQTNDIRVIQPLYEYHYNQIDDPERINGANYWKTILGQSFIGINAGAVFAGISTENISWGPGKRNNLILSNNSEGFAHITVKTSRPADIFIGKLELQFLIGKLENSPYNPPAPDTTTFKRFGRPKSDNWRYFSAFMLSYEPKWVKGLYLGFSRTYQQYDSTTRRFHNFSNYFPLFDVIFRTTDGTSENDNDKIRDQRLSFFIRWVWKKAKMEFYYEYGRNDASADLRDFLQTPEHARAYIFGFSKVFPIYGKRYSLQINAEITQIQQAPLESVFRTAGEFYTHWQLLNGYTHKGQRIGAGVNGNIQSLDIYFLTKQNRIGIQLERIEQFPDVYYEKKFSQYSLAPWIDYGYGLIGEYQWKNFIFHGKMKFIRSTSYQWQLDTNNNPLSLFNSHFQIHLLYQF